MFFTKILSGRVCSDGSNGSEDGKIAANCEIGDCSLCASGANKCKCIARTWFQTVHVIHHEHDEGEVTMLGGSNYTGNTCQITYRRHASCELKSAGGGDGGTGWNCDENNDVRLVSFTLNADDDIKLVRNGCTAGQHWTGDDSWSTSYQLQIGNDVKICFDKCTNDFTMHFDADKKHFYDWKNGTFGKEKQSDSEWCQLREIENNSGNPIKELDDTETDPITGKKLRHSYYTFFDNVD